MCRAQQRPSRRHLAHELAGRHDDPGFAQRNSDAIGHGIHAAFGYIRLGGKRRDLATGPAGRGMVADASRCRIVSGYPAQRIQNLLCKDGGLRFSLRVPIEI